MTVAYPQLQVKDFSPGENKRELGHFVDLPWKIQGNDPAWVPPLRLSVLEALDTKKNPFYHHAKIRLFNAYRGEQVVGRIAAIWDSAHNNFHNERTGFWGFFECEDKQETSSLLFRAAEQWLREKGAQAFRGPANPSMNQECGLLIDNFEQPPQVMMTHNPSFYPTLVEGSGYGKIKDLYAYWMNTPEKFDERVERIAEKVKKRGGFTIRCLDPKNFLRDVGHIRTIYNSAWEKNWGFVPMSAAEFDHTSKSLKEVLWPEFCFLAFQGEKPIGFALTLPDINQVLKNIPNGKLLPFGIFKLLWGLRPSSKKISRVRVITLGVIPEFRGTGVSTIFYLENYRQAKRMGLDGGEMSWILEDNTEMNSAIQQFAKSKPYKVYRMYEKKA
jgi:GNAT superfamily N-acetyltransferase